MTAGARKNLSMKGLVIREYWDAPCIAISSPCAAGKY